MGNIKSKNNLVGLLKKWDKCENGDNPTKIFFYKINDVTIHKINGEFFVENPEAVIGPMSQNQLIMFSKKNSDFHLKQRSSNHFVPDGDKTISEFPIENLSVSLKENKAKVCNSDAYSNHFAVKVRNKFPHNRMILDQIKTIDNNFQKRFSNMENDKQSDKFSVNLNSESQAEVASIDYSQRNNYEESSQIYRKTVKPILKNRNETEKYLKTNPIKTSKYQADTEAKKNVNFTKIISNDPKINGRFPGKKSVKTQIKELNLSYSKKKNLKRQFNRNIIEKYKESLKMQEFKNDLEMRISDQNGSAIQLNGSMDCSKANSVVLPKIQPIGFTEPINKERFRYTAFVKAENLNWSKQKSLIRRLKLAFEEKFGCTVQLGDEFIEYRGNIIYTVNIEGRDKTSVLKCRNSLPFQLRMNLILSKNNSEEVAGVLNDKWKSLVPYNPKIIINEMGSKALKVSY